MNYKTIQLTMEKIIVIGLGNPILTDDGVGVKVAYDVEKALGANIPTNLTITEASVGGLRLMELLVGYDRVILIDALLTNNGHEPGTIHQMTLADLRHISPTQHSASAHDTSLVTALEAGIEIGLHLPTEFSIYAVGVTNILDFSEEPTPAVADAIPKVVAMVLEELQLLLQPI
ncbi:MAG: hydrogenase maturation protease [Anaerolineae bacterium]|nr:hydrogenase maturation protease [Anaerolineae bacterium]